MTHRPGTHHQLHNTHTAGKILSGHDTNTSVLVLKWYTLDIMYGLQAATEHTAVLQHLH